ncbi:MAG TPA: N-acyl homoserine lactonase family protein [Gammaproteobacteria bacterium]|nr:N-acyl homoserine lactonase family protein [Gammaproteobacteria bacterium]
MAEPDYSVYAIKYAELSRRTCENFIDGDPHDTSLMPLNYYVWAIVGESRTIVVDTGFGAAVGAKRGRTITNPVETGLAALDIDVTTVTDVVITHLHYDHAGNDDLFASATYHLQDDEMRYATGRCMCHHEISKAFEADDVARMVHRVFDGRVHFHDGDDTLAPGVSLHRIGGHTMGLQAVRVNTERGAVVLASDASHFYAHLESGRAFPIVYNVGELLDGYRRLRQLASSDQHIIPGHDPLVIERFPEASSATRDWIARVDAAPRKW